MAGTTAKEVCSILKEVYRGTDKLIFIKLQTLGREFDNLSMKEDETIQVCFNHVTNIFNNIKMLGDTIEDKKVVQKELRSLLPKFNHIVVAIKESKDLSMLLVTKLMGSLQEHKESLRRCTNRPLEQAFQAKLKLSDNEENKNKILEEIFPKKGSTK